MLATERYDNATAMKMLIEMAVIPNNDVAESCEKPHGLYPILEGPKKQA